MQRTKETQNLSEKDLKTGKTLTNMLTYDKWFLPDQDETDALPFLIIVTSIILPKQNICNDREFKHTMH